MRKMKKDSNAMDAWLCLDTIEHGVSLKTKIDPKKSHRSEKLKSVKKQNRSKELKSTASEKMEVPFRQKRTTLPHSTLKTVLSISIIHRIFYYPHFIITPFKVKLDEGRLQLAQSIRTSWICTSCFIIIREI
jgi:hypothetical protein